MKKNLSPYGHPPNEAAAGSAESTGSDFMQEMLPDFIAESRELLDSAEDNLLMLAETADPELIQEAVDTCFRHFHTIKGNAALMGVTAFEGLAHAAETVLSNTRQTGGPMAENQRRWLISVVDILRASMTRLAAAEPLDTAAFDALKQAQNGPPHSLDTLPADFIGGTTIDHAEQVPLGEILIAMGKIRREDVAEALQRQRELCPVAEADDPNTVENEANPNGDNDQPRNATPTVRYKDIRVDVDKIDQLVNLAGELVTVSDMLMHRGNDQINDQLNRLVGDIQGVAMSMRMVPIGFVFRKMKRLVNDISQSLGKPVGLQIQGEDTEVDRELAEQIGDPLLHILRNAIDHGIEDPAQRQAAGKPKNGLIVLEAEHAGDEVRIIIKDDGRGLNRERILAKAVEKGLVTGTEPLTDEAVWRLILQPGFSLAETVTPLSGRGIGMDVVQKNLEKVSGRLEIQSIKGQGTTITLRIPLTLAIIDTLLVGVGENLFVIPLSAVLECADLERSNGDRPYTGAIVEVRGELVPQIRLRERYRITGPPPAGEQVVIVQTDTGRLGLVVDSALGKHQTVIKSLFIATAAKHRLQDSHATLSAFPSFILLTTSGSRMKGLLMDKKSAKPASKVSSILRLVLNPPTTAKAVFPINGLIIWAASRLYPSSRSYFPTRLFIISLPKGLIHQAILFTNSLTGTSPRHIFINE
jgi:two-component system, chemotaxis family, sensor kinase CheA